MRCIASTSIKPMKWYRDELSEEEKEIKKKKSSDVLIFFHIPPRSYVCFNRQ
jgi:hypothetical protein